MVAGASSVNLNKTTTMKCISSIFRIAAAVAGLSLALYAQDNNIFPEGTFEGEVVLSDKVQQVNAMNKGEGLVELGTLYIEPGDYKTKGYTVQVETEEGSKFLRFNRAANANNKGNFRTYVTLKLPATKPVAVAISLRWRLREFAKLDGAPEWASAQIEPAFLSADGKVLKNNYGVFRLQKSADTWQEVEKSVPVPEGAVYIMLQPGLYVCSGILDIDDLKIIPE